MTAKIMCVIIADVEMFSQNIGVDHLKTVQTRKTLHFYELRFKITFAIHANAIVEYKRLWITVTTGNFISLRYAAGSNFHKCRIGNQIYDSIAGAEHFLSKFFWYKYR